MGGGFDRERTAGCQPGQGERRPRSAGGASRVVAACCDPVRFGPDYTEDRRLADGTAVRLRLLRSDDRQKLLAAFDQLSAESRYTRFFTAMPRLPEATLT